LLSATPYASSVSPLLNTRFNLYKQLSIPIGYLPAVAQGTSDRICAALLATPLRSRSANVGRFDAALIKYGGKNEHTTGAALQGLRATQVCVIFDLPPQFLPVSSSSQECSTSVQLAYIEWFKPFRRPDPLTTMFTLSRATRNKQSFAEVIPLDRIVGSIHLVLRFGTHVDRCWKHDSVVKDCARFFFNKWITPHVFYQLQQCT
jgi:hypothetical protein